MLSRESQDCIRELAAFYRRHLTEDVMPFWATRTRDEDCGGYLTCFDRAGAVTDTDKYIWFQGRQVWMFAGLYNRLEQRDLWFGLARHGRDFIVEHAYAGNGRWHYQLDRAGRVKRNTISIFTDLFVLSGLCEYAAASGSDADHGIIEATYDAVERNALDPDFRDLFHGTWNARYERHGVFMIALHVAALAEAILGAARTKPLIDECLRRILHVFAKDEHRVLFESVGRDGGVIDEPEGRVINPGHALESMWFCMEEGLRRGDTSVVERAIEITDWSWNAGHDEQCGGIYAYLDAFGNEPLQTDWHRETGMRWDDKPWWVHSEALYALALAAVTSGSDERFRRFLDLHDWTQRHFFDPEYGEWYSELWRDGRPKLTDKGTPWKAAYHLPRALLFLARLFEHASPESAG